MKRCPECRRNYYDDSLLYCLDDGAALLEGPGSDQVKTAILPSVQGSEASTKLLPKTGSKNEPPQVMKAGAESRNTPRLLLISSISIIAIGFTVWWLLPVNSGKQIGSIAVLPILNTTGDPDIDYLSDGVTDNIIDHLARLPDLKVIAHNAVFHYKGKEMNPRSIGSELAVEAVLMGRLAKRGEAVSISLELIDANDNSHIWGKQYDRQMSDLIALQSDIPLDVSQKLRLRLSSETKERLTRAHTDNLEAYEFYLRGKYAWETWTLEGAKQAIIFYEEAIKRDPNYALAYAGLADVYFWGRFSGAGLPEKEAHRLGRQAATKALSLDPDLSEAHAALSEVLLWDEWDFAGAERELKRAIDLSPGNVGPRHAFSHFLLYVGRIDEAFEQARILLQLDPISEVPLGHMCYTEVYARRYADGIATCKRDIELFPDTAQGHTLAKAYEQTGRHRESFEQYLKAFAQDGKSADLLTEYRSAFERGGMSAFLRRWIAELKSAPDADDNKVTIAELHARLGEADLALEWLEKAYVARAQGLVRLKEEIGFDNVRSDSRFADLMKRVGLPQ